MVSFESSIARLYQLFERAYDAADAANQKALGVAGPEFTTNRIKDLF